MSEAVFSIKLSAASARIWAEQMAGCLRGLPDGDRRRDVMITKVSAALKRRELFGVEYSEGCAVMAPTTYARGLLIEARGWT